jgi:hypothetical protein
MRVLAEKSKFIIADNIMEMTILNRVARGDKEILSGIKMSSGVYKKAPIADDIENEYFNSTGKIRPDPGNSVLKTKPDFRSIYAGITSLEPPELTHASDLIVNPFIESLELAKDVNSCSVGNEDSLDFFNEENDLSASVKEWLDVVDDETDINNYVVQPDIIISDLKVDGSGNIFVYIILVIVIFIIITGISYYIYVQRNENENSIQIGQDPEGIRKDEENGDGASDAYQNRPADASYADQPVYYDDGQNGIGYDDKNSDSHKQYSHGPSQNNFSRPYSQAYNSYQAYTGYHDQSYPQVYQHPYPQGYQDGYPESYQQSYPYGYPQNYHQGYSPYSNEYQQEYSPSPQAINLSSKASSTTATPPSYNDFVKQITENESSASDFIFHEKDPEKFKNQKN